MTLTAAALREHFSAPDLTDTALERLIADAEGAVTARFGSGGPYVERFDGRCQHLFLGRVAGEISSVVEGGTTLDGDEYSLRFGGRALARSGDATRWGRDVVVTYVGADDVRRERVVIDLVKLAAAHSGYTVLADGAFRGGVGDYQEAREGILSELAGSVRRVA